MKSAISQATLAEWKKLPPTEIACINQAMQQRGTTLDSTIQQGILPTDKRLADDRAFCQVQISGQAASSAPDTPTTTSSNNQSPRTYWMHNGSIAYLVVNKDRRGFYYQAPRQGLQDVGATPGAPLFNGKALGGLKYEGTAYLYKRKCGRMGYAVSGSVLDDYSRVVLQGQAPRVGPDCQIIGYVNDKLEFSLLQPQPQLNEPANVLPELVSSGAMKPNESTPTLQVHTTPARQRAVGEFARLISVPIECQRVRELGKQMYVQVPGGRRVPGPACSAALACMQSVLSQSAASLQYLNRNPEALNALRGQMPQRNTEVASNIFDRLLEKIARQIPITLNSVNFRADNCEWHFSMLNTDWLSVEKIGYPERQLFDRFVAIGQALVQNSRANYKADESRYAQLIDSVDRYEGIERLEQAQSLYRFAFENDDLVKMLNGRAPMLLELNVADARKRLLDDQGLQLETLSKQLRSLKSELDDDLLKTLSEPDAQSRINEIDAEVTSLTALKLTKRSDHTQAIKNIEAALHDVSIKMEASRSRKLLIEQQAKELRASDEELSRLIGLIGTDDIKRLVGTGILDVVNEVSRQIEATKIANPIQRGDITDLLNDVNSRLNNVYFAIRTAQAEINRLESIDDKRRHLIQASQEFLTIFSAPKMKSRLNETGIATFGRLEKTRADLLAVETLPILDRPDLEPALSETENNITLFKRFLDAIAEIDAISTDLSSLQAKITSRNRRFLDAVTEAKFAATEGAVRGLLTTRGPLTAEQSQQIVKTKETLALLANSIDAIMDTTETAILTNAFPFRSEDWSMLYGVDKITDQRYAQALKLIQGDQAKYQIRVSCGLAGLDIILVAFEKDNDKGKTIPWQLAESLRQVRVRINSEPAFYANLEMHGYVNFGQINAEKLKNKFTDLLDSNRFIIADIFPDEQLEVATRFPETFRRICVLLNKH